MQLISLLVLCACVCSGAQVVMSGSGSDARMQFRYETRIEPEIPGQSPKGFGGGMVIDTSFHRYVWDDSSRRYYGYDLSIEPMSGGEYRVTFLPLSIEPDKARFKLSEGWAKLPLLRMPGPQIVRSKDTIAVELFSHPTTGQKIVDYLFVEDRNPSGAFSNEAARDFVTADVNLKLQNMRVTLNGKRVEPSGMGLSGEAVYVYWPGQGRYVMSLFPHPDLGFQRSGEVRGNRLSLQVGSNRLEIDCDEAIAPGEGVYNLYVHYDAAWRPRNGSNDPQFGAGPARNLVPSRR